jgi:prepilin-type processing-associated H-X9-DG protein
LDNARQVMEAVQMFTHDHHDLLPPNPDDGTRLAGYTWCVGDTGIGGQDEFNPDLLTDTTRCLVAPYLNGNASVFRCTADSRTGLYDGAALYPNSPLKGTRVPAARTISMSQAVGTIDPGFSSGGAHSGVPNLPVNGPWLTGAHGGNNSRTGPWRTYGKISQMVIPVPAELIVITEESPLSINDASCATCVEPANAVWIDYPSTLHNNGAVESFADGHVELHKWVGSSVFLSAFPSQRHVSASDPDWSWFAQRNSARF